MEIHFGINKWKISSYVIGGISIVINLNLFYLNQAEKHEHYSIFLILLAINLIASIIWIYGAASNRTVLMQILLIWWTIPVMLSLGSIMIVIFEIVHPSTPHPDGLVQLLFGFVLVATVIVLVIYALAVLCFVRLRKAIERSRSEIPRMNIEYSTVKTIDVNYY